MSLQESSALRDLTPTDIRVVDAPPIYKHTECDYEEVFGQLAALPLGKALTFQIPSDVNGKQFEASIRAAAIRRGTNISIRHIGADVYVSVRPVPKLRATANKDRDQEIIAALESGESQASIAGRLSISRQRVGQIVSRKFSTLAPPERRAALLQFIEPYLPYIRQKFCFICGADMSVDARNRTRSLWACALCKKAMARTNRIKSLLVAWQNGSQQGLRQASYEIKKFNIKPEHLASIRKVEP